MNQYLKITIPCNSALHEILIAELDQLQFDSFQEKDNELEAFINEEFYKENLLEDVLIRYKIPGNFKVENLVDINWNEEWEKNFEPVNIEDKVLIRASFHPSQPNFKYEAIINPKMSFGTGHHETTYLMVSELLKLDFQGKKFLDVGTGTGILGIMAYKLGAKSISATDIDTWSVENCRENFELNSIGNSRIIQGTIDNLTLSGSFDIICANINKNVLIDEIPVYAGLLNRESVLLLSGFYKEDIDDLSKIAAKSQLLYKYHLTRNNWALVRLSRVDT